MTIFLLFDWYLIICCSRYFEKPTTDFERLTHIFPRVIALLKMTVKPKIWQAYVYFDLLNYFCYLGYLKLLIV